jgi:D-alanyl-D-alanine carboxypeptidase/D-alanyl-D-alanine-endopeptidase (penicillin-binding protein 4)
MATHPDYEAYKDSFPILGVDGSLATAATPNSPAIGKVFAKTGTRGEPDPLNNRIILQTKALAGYITTASEREVAFAIMVGPAPVTDIQQLLEIGNDLGRIAEIIYTEN